MLLTVFLWQTVYGQAEAVAGVTRSQMISYAVLSVLLGALLQAQVEYSVGSRVRDGQIALDLMRPAKVPLRFRKTHPAP